MAKAKTMNRSRNQLATAYAPESFFTFEGGMGACIARSSPGEFIQLSESTIELVFERMKELGEGAATERIRSLREILDWRVRYITAKVQDKPGNSYGLAAANVMVGRLDEALGYLEQQCRNGGEGIMFNFVAVEPVFDPLHGDPRFARVVDCTGIPHDSPAYRAFQTKAGAS